MEGVELAVAVLLLEDVGEAIQRAAADVAADAVEVRVSCYVCSRLLLILLRHRMRRR